jgi:hypothetical protein
MRSRFCATDNPHSSGLLFWAASLADGVGLIVEFLPVYGEAALPGCALPDIRQPPKACRRCLRRVIEGAVHAGVGQRIVILDKDQVDHERMTSRGVKWSPALEISANLRIAIKELVA